VGIIASLNVARMLALSGTPAAPSAGTVETTVGVEPPASKGAASKPAASVEPLSVEPLSVEPLSVEPLSVEPLSVEPLSVEPASVGLADEQP
jgi:hypothetical protein